MRGKYNIYFGDEAFKHPKIQRRPPISHIDVDGRTVFFEDGSSLRDVDHIIFGTGYTWTLPFLPHIKPRNNRIPDLYLHIFHGQDPTLAFIGAVCPSPLSLLFFNVLLTRIQVGAGFTFKVFEWQSVLAARVFAGRAQLPPLEERRKWEADRIKERGDGPGFTLLAPDFEEYFELVRQRAGEPDESQGRPGRRLPKFDSSWVKTFWDGHQRRVEMWKRANAKGVSIREAFERPVAKL